MKAWSHQAVEQGVADLVWTCHGLARHAGWWDAYDIMPEQYQPLYIATQLGLIHSETSEAMEGLRKGKQDDHLPERPAIEVELADVLIRVCDLAGALGLDLEGAVRDKLIYNTQRADHTLAVRAQSGGKRF